MLTSCIVKETMAAALGNWPSPPGCSFILDGQIGYQFSHLIVSRKSNKHICQNLIWTKTDISFFVHLFCYYIIHEYTLMLNSPAGAAVSNIKIVSCPNTKQLPPINSNIIKTVTLPKTLYDPFILFLRYSFISCHFFYSLIRVTCSATNPNSWHN